MVDRVRLELTKDSRRVLDEFRKSVSHEFFISAIESFFGREATKLASFISKNFLSGQRVKVRTGTLRRSIAGRFEVQGRVPQIRVGIFRGPALRYAGVQEFGTKGKNPDSPFRTIVPRKAKALAIPTGPALTPAGVARYPGPRQYPKELTFIPFRGRVAIGGLFETESLKRIKKTPGQFSLRDAKLVYFLLRKVDIKPKNFLRDGVLQRLPVIANELGEFLAGFLKGQRSTRNV